MAEPDDAAETAARLERALERIALASRAAAPQGTHSGAPAETRTDRAEVAARLDGLIAELRAALGSTPGG